MKKNNIESISIINNGTYFNEYVNELVSFFAAKKKKVKVYKKFDKKNKTDLVIVINPLKKRISNLSRRHVLVSIQTEQIYNPYEKGLRHYYSKINTYKNVLKKFDLIFEWNPTVYKYYSRVFNNIRFLKHGYLSIYKKYYNEKIEKKYDLFFIGNPTGINQKRKIMLESLGKKYSFHPFSSNISGTQLWGKEKYIAIQESKICINIHFDHSAVFESPRIYEFLSMQSFVLSEYIFDSFPFVQGKDYVYTYLENFDNYINHYLNNPIERKKIALNGHKNVQKTDINDQFENFYLSVDLEYKSRILSPLLVRLKIKFLINIKSILKALKNNFMRTLKK